MKYALFICTENSARSQMAEGFFNSYNKNPEYAGISAGLEPAKNVNHLAVLAMKEKGIDMASQAPKLLTLEMVEKAEKIFTMGCIDKCPAAPPEKTADWKLEDPAGKGIEKFREVRDEIEIRVKKLIAELA